MKSMQVNGMKIRLTSTERQIGTNGCVKRERERNDKNADMKGNLIYATHPYE